jgi:hypothetical protein
VADSCEYGDEHAEYGATGLDRQELIVTSYPTSRYVL